MTAFAHHNLSVKIVPIEGPYAGQQITLTSAESCKMDPGGKATALKGLAVGPVSVVAGAASPTCEVKLSDATEAWDLTSKIKVGGDRVNVIAVFLRSNLGASPQLATFVATGILENGGGFDSSTDNGPNDTLKFACTDIRYNGQSLLAEAPLR